MKNIFLFSIILLFISMQINNVSAINNIKKNLINNIFNIKNNNIITSNQQTLTLKISEKANSYIQIPENTQLIGYNGNSKSILFPPFQLDELKVITSKTILIDNKEINRQQIAGIYKFNPQFINLKFSQNINIQLVLKKKSTTYPLYIYYLDNLKSGWKQLDGKLYVMDKKTSSINFKTNKFGYYMMIQNKYIDENPIKSRDLQGNTNISNSNISLLNVKNKLQNILKMPAIQKMADNFFNKLAPKNYQYFLSFDTQLQTEYNKYALAYYNTFINLENFVQTKDSRVKKVILANLPILLEGIKAKRDLELKYVNKNTISGNIIYSPKNERINTATLNLQNKILKKLNNLIASKSISLEEYSVAMNAYNYFILHISIYLDSYSDIAKKELIKQLNILLPIYKKLLISQ